VIVSIHQPAYLPWLGYLARIAASDVFVFLDTVQFERGSFTNRNRIKANGRLQWLTVPVRSRGYQSRTLLEMEIDNHRDWRTKHLRAIEQSYSRAPHFGPNAPRLASLVSPGENQFATLCFAQLMFWLDEFQINTRVVRASDMQVDGRKSELVLNICRRLGASKYISGTIGRHYLDEAKFSAAGIDLTYQDYRHPVYPQLGGEFIAGLSAVDYWMNCGRSVVFAGAS
jgi:hypothetical protein